MNELNFTYHSWVSKYKSMCKISHYLKCIFHNSRFELKIVNFNFSKILNLSLNDRILYTGVVVRVGVGRPTLSVTWTTTQWSPPLRSWNATRSRGSSGSTCFHCLATLWCSAVWATFGFGLYRNLTKSCRSVYSDRK